jgi:hypothetical protein
MSSESVNDSRAVKHEEGRSSCIISNSEESENSPTTSLQVIRSASRLSV